MVKSSIADSVFRRPSLVLGLICTSSDSHFALKLDGSLYLWVISYKSHSAVIMRGRSKEGFDKHVLSESEIYASETKGKRNQHTNRLVAFLDQNPLFTDAILC